MQESKPFTRYFEQTFMRSIREIFKGLRAINKLSRSPNPLNDPISYNHDYWSSRVPETALPVLWHIQECFYYVHCHHSIERGGSKGSELFCKMSDCGLGLEGVGGGGGNFVYTFPLLLLVLLLLSWLYRLLLSRACKVESP